MGTRLTADNLPQVLQANTFNVVMGSELTVTFGPEKTFSLFEDGILLTDQSVPLSQERHDSHMPRRARPAPLWTSRTVVNGKQADCDWETDLMLRFLNAPPSRYEIRPIVREERG